MEETMRLESFEDKTTKTGKEYTEFITTAGKFTAWECAEELKKHMGKWVVVDTKKNGNFNNIKAYVGAGEERVVDSPKSSTGSQGVSAKSEHNFRIKITQTTKGHHHWEVTVRGDTPEEEQENMLYAIKLAKDTCDHLNTPVMPDSMPREDQKEGEQ